MAPSRRQSSCSRRTRPRVARVMLESPAIQVLYEAKKGGWGKLVVRLPLSWALLAGALSQHPWATRVVGTAEAKRGTCRGSHSETGRRSDPAGIRTPLPPRAYPTRTLKLSAHDLRRRILHNLAD